jgi:hypothetical protein
MGVPVLVCECGMRLKAPGATSGRVGRCPKCGATLTVSVPAAPPEPKAHREEAGPGYFLDPNPRTSRRASRETPQEDVNPIRVPIAAPKVRPPMADGLIPTLSRVESWWGPSLLYPLRGADSLAMLGIMGTVFWVLTILVPEYCLTLIEDAEKLGSPSMGYLIALISGFPAAFLLLPALFYSVQYLGRVLVSSPCLG